MAKYSSKPQTIQSNSFDAYKALDLIDFGDIDGLYDPNISEYFIDDNYWEQLVEGRKFFVIGRKGTGKSAIYNWIHAQQGDKGTLVSNLSFKTFPFEKFLQLTDDDFSRPNQYQSIWRNIILSEIAKHIIIDEKSSINDDYIQIRSYVGYKFGTDLNDLHKKVTKQTTKTTSGLFLQGSGIGYTSETAKDLGDELTNITLINAQLEQLIKGYLKTSSTSSYIIQFDQLDDNYTTYIKNDHYFQSIISLFKVVYDLNQTFHQISVPVKIICYLRSDIFYEINNYDAESARWDQFKLQLNWAIINRSDWDNPALLKLLNSRIKRSLVDIKDQNPFFKIFNPTNISLLNNNSSKQSVFAYMVKKSLHRPRDIVQFCIKIQEDARKWKKLNVKNILDAEKEYSSWLLGELANEFGPLVLDKSKLYEFLRNLGESHISFNVFRSKYAPYENKIGLDAEQLLKLLYRLGIIFNVNKTLKHTEYFSVIRNEKSSYNSSLNILLHPGFNKGLHTFRE
ncbi:MULTISPECIES: P-loop ATPase, Sll1717 family [unclassified Mucilaginibacter]|uniref:P-loop ATPase, Sll1717 family n=1 Tax=unclassified Mucilaginibacter TaxID=2617802 RepID=UPI002AC92BAD|nr:MULTISPECIES: hypothetical protein [unclassified Mucilaginibacter]MEB0263612.1 hypothetical protein [Mucilaginibacter sp. 10I4]MEB0278633.1 hypothetical protein [Mucilaginibacter sp. 10B2]MEB0299343.1 hypothetical protein [Mucilaginibacter sp. 5C4]WPX23413.1 hypothetical protein RHM67_19240 [Mucilaginibacter sp. 5C4]